MNPLLKLYFAIEGAYYKFLDFLQKLGIPVYRFFVSPLEERGVPSFPVFILIILLILGFLFLFLIPKQSSTSVFVVRVLSNGKGVGNASVVFLGANNVFLGRVLTDATGTVVFNGSALTADVVAQGFLEKKVVLINGLNVVSLQVSSVENNSLINSSTTSSNAAGSPGVSFTSQSTGLPGNGQALNGSSDLEVDLLYNGVPVDGFVTVFDNLTSYALDSGQTSSGSVYFSGISLGSTVYFSVSGNYSLNSSPVIVLKNGFNKVVLNVSPVTGGCVGSACNVSCVFDSDCESSNPSSPFCVNGFCSATNQTGSSGASYIYLFNSVDNSSVNGFVAVFNLNNQVVFQGRTSKGVFSFNALQGYYYAVVNAPGFVSGQSSFFQTPVNYSVFLTPVSVGSASLLVNVFDDNGDPLVGGSVVVKSLNNGVWEPLTMPENNSNGVVAFSNLPVNVSVRVVASDGGAVGSNTTYLLNGSNSVSVYLFVNNGSLNVSAFDALTGNLVVDFNASVSFSNVIGNYTVSCSPTPPHNWCLLNVEANKNWFVNFTAPGYYSDLTQASVDVNSTSSVAVNLTPTGVGGVSLAGVYDSNWRAVNPSTGTLFFGGFYNACFNVHTNTSLNAVNSGFFFTSQPWVNISSWNSTLGAHGGQSGGCPDPTTSALINGNYSSINLTTIGPLNGYYCVGFTPVPSGDVWDNLSLEYASFALFPNASFSFPLNSNVKVCGLNVSSSYYSVSSPNDVCGSGCGGGLNIGNLSVSMSQNLWNGTVLSCGDGRQVSDCNNFQAYSDPESAGLAGPLNVSFSIQPASFNSPDLLVFSAPGNTVLSVNLTSNSPATATQVGEGEWDVSSGLSSGVITGYVLVNLTTSSSSTYDNPVSSVSVINVNFSNGTSSVGLSFKFNSTPLYPPNILAGFDCAGVPFINLTYSDNIYLKSGGTGWLASCNSVPMMVSDVFPADAVKVYFSGDALTSIKDKDGKFLYNSMSNHDLLASCFQFDDNGGSFYTDSFGTYGIMRFTPYYQDCPLTVVGNDPLVWKSNGSIASSVTFSYLFAYSNPVGNCPNWIKVGSGVTGDCKVLNFTVFSYNTGEGLNFLPAMSYGYAYTFYPGTQNLSLSLYPLKPELWVLVNNNQFPRSVNLDYFSSVAQNNLSFSFNGGGATAVGFDLSVFNGFSENVPGVGVIPYGRSFDQNTGGASVSRQYFAGGLISLENRTFDYFLSLDQKYLIPLDERLKPFSYYNSSFQNALSVVLNSLGTSIFVFAPNIVGGGVGDYLPYVNSVMNSTALWRSSVNYLWCEPSSTGGYDDVSYCKGSEADWFNYTAALAGSGNIWLNTTGPLKEVSLKASPYNDQGAPLKYFSNGVNSEGVGSSVFNFVRVFKVDSNDSFIFNGARTDSGDVCPNVAEPVNSFLTNSTYVFSTDGLRFLHRIPRGFYVVNYTYTIDSKGNPAGGLNGWTVQSTPLYLNSNNYFQNLVNGGCDKSQIPSSLPLCGYIFSTNNHEDINGGSGLGDCILSSSAYLGNNYTFQNLTGLMETGYNSNQLQRYISAEPSFDGNLYMSSLILLNLSCNYPNSCTSGDLKNYPLSNFLWFPSTPTSTGYTGAVCNSGGNLFTQNALLFGVLDDAGNMFIPDPANCGAGLALTPNPGLAAAWTCTSVSPSNPRACNGRWIFNNFDALGLH